MRCTDNMRTTLGINGSVLAAARAIANAENRSLGSVISELARRSLVPEQRSNSEVPTFEVAADAPSNWVSYGSPATRRPLRRHVILRSTRGPAEFVRTTRTRVPG